MFNTKAMSAVVALVAFTFSANSMAQAYAGGTVGQARWETSCSQASFAIPMTPLSPFLVVITSMQIGEQKLATHL